METERGGEGKENDLPMHRDRNNTPEENRATHQTYGRSDQDSLVKRL
jgi:hypothetical protein